MNLNFVCASRGLLNLSLDVLPKGPMDLNFGLVLPKDPMDLKFRRASQRSNRFEFWMCFPKVQLHPRDSMNLNFVCASQRSAFEKLECSQKRG